MSNFSKVNLGISTKRYTHDMSFDNNTTLSFGVCQPLFCQLMNDKDKLSGNIRQLVRLAPLPVPSFGRMRLVNKLRFVQMTDICPYYEALLSGSYVNTSDLNYLPKEVLTSQIDLLTMLVLQYSVIDYFKVDSSSTTKYVYQNINLPSVLKEAQQKIYNAIQDNGDFYPIIPEPKPHVGNVGTAISPDSADYLISDDDSFVCFRLTERGKRLRNVLIGLGYALDVSCKDRVSLLPLLAYYKAWYDCYAPSRDTQWNQTNAFILIDFCFQQYVTDIEGFTTAQGASEKVQKAILGFFDDLANTWYVANDDFVSAHRLNAVSSNTTGFGDITKLPYTSSSSTAGNVISVSENSTPVFAPVVGINQFALETLQRISKYLNKDTVIGKKVSTWLKAHFGADVASSFFKDSVSLDDVVVSCNINDVFSTADTSSADGSGEQLGSYAGKGLGFGDGSFKFTAPTFGYFVVVSCLVPDSKYFQGIDPMLFGVDRFTLPNSDFDALSYEVTPSSFLCSHNDIFIKGQKSTSDKGFGFVPRYSAFKTRRNIVNGDMSRRGTIASYSPYYLDKILTENAIRSEKNADGSYTFVAVNNPLPVASEVWRYPTRYPWLGNFNRIFYNSGNEVFDDASSDDAANDFTNTPIDDNFIVQSVISMKLTNGLKPIAMSYDVYDDDVDNSSKTITQE
nr:hypothetical protein [Prevotella sp.]